MKKTIWIVVLCVVLTLAFVGCSSQEPAGEQAGEQIDEQTEAQGEEQSQVQMDHELAGEWRYTTEIVEKMSSMGDDVLEAVKNTIVTFDGDGTASIKNGTNETIASYTFNDGYVSLEQEDGVMYLTLEGDILTAFGDPYFKRN